MKAVCCLSIDVINADKPPASLAFLAGACEAVGCDYFCHSVNIEMVKRLTDAQYQSLYSHIKLDTLNEYLPNIQFAFDGMVEEITKRDPSIILVSLFSYFQIPVTKLVLSLIKKSLPDAEIIVGGPGVSKTNKVGHSYGRQLLDQNIIDYYVLGEGDQILLDFLRGDRTNPLFNADGQDLFVPQINDLDDKFLMPSYKNIDFSFYQNLENKQKGVISITTSRGCVRACTFCDIAQSWPRFRFRSGKSIVSEIMQHYKDTGITNFYITDSLINGSVKSFNEFNLEMIKLKQEHPGLADFSYNGMFIVRDKRTHTEDFFRNMKLAGCESLAIGVETGSDRLRYDMNKKFKNADLDYHLQCCSKYGIKNFFLMFVGYPTETDEDFQQTLHMLERYQKYLLDGTIGGITFSGIFSMIPDSPVHLNRDSIGIEILQDYDNKSLNWINTMNPDLNIKKRILRDMAFRKRAAELRYPVPYTHRYLEYLSHVSPDFVTQSD